eukprot:scaffold971_cov107-Isochrysis_galbana.AAC.3
MGRRDRAEEGWRWRVGRRRRQSSQPLLTGGRGRAGGRGLGEQVCRGAGFGADRGMEGGGAAPPAGGGGREVAGERAAGPGIRGGGWGGHGAQVTHAELRLAVESRHRNEPIVSLLPHLRRAERGDKEEWDRHGGEGGG